MTPALAELIERLEAMMGETLAANDVRLLIAAIREREDALRVAEKENVEQARLLGIAGSEIARLTAKLDSAETHLIAHKGMLEKAEAKLARVREYAELLRDSYGYPVVRDSGKILLDILNAEDK